ncbi:YNG2 [Cyberlindnera jadinii]|uniref:Chromatin modification-related protein n=1 Tax=Cyberlindnera jadinii (strain ATCC 18201 / CBS 1600 / BCRC 20928 / JCM 3617 / NBRC 0987 / NRRL Y-1542) TaxID=983966 RepID=A0A0H5C6E9_CYBJN|nr:hypothetical protein CYBJADRAFT_167561 [Cyberlindnera jadinii NRRL Y-1542]ODV73523.1 hypothetical protein CYBJADRAFT_167561 [Cyberlindnera jadinii NRRL Y-1542]CEP23593.1 YNG2 [Cyberlindnera jadinii]
MDTAATLDQYTQDLSNLPAELQYLLAELGTSDSNLYETRKKMLQKDGSIHKFIKQHGSLTKNPKEAQLYPKIREDLNSAEQLQKKKVITANTALFLTAKHLLKLESDMEKLKSEGLLVVEDMDIDLDEVMSSKTSSRAGTTDLLLNGDFLTTSNATVASMTTTQKKARKSSVRASTPAAVTALRANKRQKTVESSASPDVVDSQQSPGSLMVAKGSNKGSATASALVTASPKVEQQGKDEENELYCFCQRVSFGEMVGCDNDDCKYEWFHYECVGLKEPPKGKWYCPDCSERLKREKKKKK